MINSAEVSLLRMHQHSIRNKDIWDLFHQDFFVFAGTWSSQVKSLSQIPTGRTSSRHCGQGGCPEVGNALHKQWNLVREGPGAESKELNCQELWEWENTSQDVPVESGLLVGSYLLPWMCHEEQKWVFNNGSKEKIKVIFCSH